MVCFLAVLLAAVSSPTSAPAAAPTAIPISAPVARQLDESLKQLSGTQAGNAPALAVAIVQRGKIAYARTFGSADDQTRFRIASLTKMMTAVSVLQLVDRGRIKLDERVSTYLPNAPYADRITVRQLLNHTSGLYNYGDDSFKAGANKKPTTPQNILELVAAQPLVSPPGTRFSYSNSGYVVLGQIVEHVSGRSLTAYEQQAIFSVAGMTQTRFGDPASSIPVATGFLSGTQSADAYAYDPSWFYADGDIVSTAMDIARFDLALMAGKLVSAKSFALAQTDPVDAPMIGGKWGLGFTIIDGLGKRFVGHHGGVPGFVAEDEIIQSDGLAIVVLANAGDFATSRVNASVFTTLYPADVATAEDHEVTRRFRLILDGLIAGRIDRSQFSEDANAAFSDAVVATASAQLAAFGPVSSSSYMDRRRAGERTTYRYRVAFAKANLVFSYVVGSDGKAIIFRSNG
jgi:D-alanyl-D-alanine carboxypeptidase